MRTICIDSDTVAHLKTWKQFQANALNLIQPELKGGRMPLQQTDATPAIVSDAGSWIWLRNFNRWWENYREKAGFPDLRIHELRHTSASLLLANGMDVLTVSNRLGHASPSITLDVYSHCIPGRDAAAADLMGSILGASQKPDDPEPSDEPLNSKTRYERSPRIISLSKSA